MNSLIQTIEILSAEEIKRLIELESIIQSGIKTFISVGKALIEIQDKRLYRTMYPSFEEYAHEQWGISRQSAYQYISAAKVVQNLEEVSEVLPTNEAQARELAKLPKQEQQEVWLNVVETAEAKEQPITAKAVREVVQTKVSAIADTPKIEPSVKLSPFGEAAAIGAGLGQGKVHKISAAERIQQEESIAELRERPTMLEYQILQGELERARKELAATNRPHSSQRRELTYEALQTAANKIYSPTIKDKLSLSVIVRDTLLNDGFVVSHNQYTMFFDAYWKVMQDGGSIASSQQKYFVHSLDFNKRPTNKLQEDFATNMSEDFDNILISDVKLFLNNVIASIDEFNKKHKKYEPLYLKTLIWQIDNHQYYTITTDNSDSFSAIFEIHKILKTV